MTPAESYQHLELLKLSKEHYRKKTYQEKDRRDIDELEMKKDEEEEEFKLLLFKN
jgi:ribosome-associated heat shock protein Hsp15